MASSAEVDVDRINEITIREIQKRYDEGTLTCERLVSVYLKRIARYDMHRDGLHSVIEINPEAPADARRIDRERSCGLKKGLMHGIPVLIKDNINTMAPMHTRAGSLALAGNTPPYEATIVTKLREAGAIILGKANLTEFANIMTKGMPGGYSSMGGQTWCPYKKNESPSGSSSGSAVAVAANLCMVSIGTETTGSIIAPAHKNGIVGIKPTAGLVSRYGILPVSKTLDIAGPMARTVEDAAILLSAIYGPDPEDEATMNIPMDYRMDFVDNADNPNVRGLRIGINRTNAEWLDEELPVYGELIDMLRQEGAVIIEGFALGDSESVNSIIVHELRESMNEYFGTMSGDLGVKSLSDVVAFNEKYRDVHRYGQVYLEMADTKFPEGTRSPEYIAKMIEREKEIEQLESVFTDNNLDIMFFDTMTDLPPAAGFPSLTVPVSRYRNGLPMGTTWIAGRFEEEKLIRFAAALEKLTKARFSPDLGIFEKKET